MIPNFLHNLVNSSEMKIGPLSATNALGTLNLAMMFLWTNRHRVVALMFTNASASAHSVKYSIAVMMNVLPFPYWRGPTTSKAHIEKGHGADKAWSAEAGAWILLACVDTPFWHQAADQTWRKRARKRRIRPFPQNPTFPLKLTQFDLKPNPISKIPKTYPKQLISHSQNLT